MHIYVSSTQISQNKDLVPHPQKLSILKKIVFFVFYRHFCVHDGTSQIHTINGSTAKFRAECLRFYQISANYLKDNLPINVKVIKHAQYLHHEKQLHPFSNHAIANLTLKVTNVLNGQLASVFKMEGSREEIVDKIRFQRSQYQLEDITEDFYLKPKPKTKSAFSRKSGNLENEILLFMDFKNHPMLKMETTKIRKT